MWIFQLAYIICFADVRININININICSIKQK